MPGTEKPTVVGAKAPVGGLRTTCTLNPFPVLIQYCTSRQTNMSATRTRFWDCCPLLGERLLQRVINPAPLALLAKVQPLDLLDGQMPINCVLPG
jgi:hypothetical protein